MARFRAKDLSKRFRKTTLVRTVRSRSRDVANAATELVRAFVGQRAALRPVTDLRRLAAEARNGIELDARERHSLGDHLARVVHKRLGQLEENREFSVAADPVESLHDLRVASRRLRAFVDVFSPLLETDSKQRAAKPLRNVTRAVRTLRDMDVRMEHLQARLQTAATDRERALLEHLLEHGVKSREKERVRAEKHLRRVDFGELRASVLAVLGETVAALPPYGAATSELGRSLVSPFIQGVERHAPPRDGAENSEALHAFRIQIKKLRYALELFEPLLGTSYGALRGRAQRLQETLGSHHDIFVLEELVEQLRTELQSRGRTVLLAGLSALSEALAAERRHWFEEFRADAFVPGWWEQTLRAALESEANGVPALEASPSP